MRELADSLYLILCIKKGHTYVCKLGSKWDPNTCNVIVVILAISALVASSLTSFWMGNWLHHCACIGIANIVSLPKLCAHWNFSKYQCAHWHFGYLRNMAFRALLIGSSVIAHSVITHARIVIWENKSFYHCARITFNTLLQFTHSHYFSIIMHT